ncbi:RNA-directed DNA polymerase, eukaryota, reverse transcriptase zinc-binding domain protein [Tanacetum coccineum]
MFMLVMEVLTLIVLRRVHASETFRYRKHCEEMQLINVCFEDDLFIFARGEVKFTRLIMESLGEFQRMSSLVLSIPKSTTYFCNVPNHVKHSILNFMPFVEGELPVKYLSVPLISSRLLTKDCKILVARVKNRIGDWKNKSLSFAGRLQLCKSVLSSMHVYWASVLMIPIGIIQDIQQHMHGFLWCNRELKHGKAKVAWEDIFLPKNEGRNGKSASWRDSNGLLSCFSIGDAWEALRLRGIEVSWYRIVWFSHCIPRHAFHLWLAMRNSLKTQDKLWQWDVGVGTDLNLLQCAFYSSQLDSHAHLFFECPYSSKVWKLVRPLAVVGSGRKNYKNSGSKSRDLKKSLEDMEYNGVSSIEANRGSEGVNLEGSYGFNSTNSISRAYELEDEVSNFSKNNVVKNAKKIMKLSANKDDVVGEMPVPFSENVIHNPGGNVANVASNEVRRDQGNGFSRNVAWPSLNKVNGKDKGNSEVGNKATDTDMLDNTSETKPISFISNKVVDMDPLLEDGSKKWDLTLVGYFVGLKMSYAKILGHLRRMWGTHHLAEIITNECGLYFLKFRSIEGMNFVLENRPWLAWNSHGISSLASSIGNPIIMDRITASMCEKAYGRASFARVLIEVYATKELPESIEICYSKLGKSMKLRVEYAWKPPLCTHCKVFSHDYRGCVKRERTQEEISGKVNAKKGVTSGVEENLNGDGGWQDVRKSNRNEASSSGRGGMNGRGGLSGGRGSVHQRENNEGIGMKFVPMRNVGKRVDNVHVIEGESSGSKANKDKNVDNAKSGTIKMTNEKAEMRGKIDLATELGMEIDENEKKRWYEDLIKYYADKCEAKARQNLIVGIKWRITKLKQDIIHRNTYVSKTDEMIEQYEILMGEKVDKMMEGFQEDLVQSMGEEVVEDTSDSAKFMTRDEVHNVMEDNNILMQDKMKKGCRIIVGWDPNVISSQLLSQTSQVMHFSIRRVCDSRDIYVSFIYGENNVKDWRDLWENLRGSIIELMVAFLGDCVDSLSIEDIKVTGLFFTWIQFKRDPSKGVLKKLDRVMGNGYFLSGFSSSFVNFFPFASYDHSPAVLVMPGVKGKNNKAFRFMNFLADKEDFVDVVRQHWFVPVKGFNMYVLAKRLKSLKKHMRSFNKKNGDVCEKVKSLKEGLARIQEELSRHPLNVDLKDEELIYSYAVTKNKIEVIYDDVGNAIHGSNIVDAFVSHFKKFFGTRDDVFPIDDPGNLFSKKLNAETALDLIKPIFNGEIKAALFDIKDNKASGPDGYSSKFFKSAWSMVGRDTCSAVREFFTSGKFLGELNASIISLIPKVINPKNVVDYRPISCCNVVYKTISKIITNRIKGVLNDLVGENQSAFIPKRQITDNILLTQEFMRGYGWSINKGASRCTFKIDIQKAYDILLHFLQMKDEKNFKYHWGCKELKITSLCFVDDLLMLCHGDLISVSVLRRGLDEFCVSSGLRPSMSKSEAFFGNVPEEVVADIKLVLPFKVGVLPIKYLGVPMMSKRLTSKDYKPLIEMIKKRIGDWRNKALSFAGRLQLISSVLSSMQVYWVKIGNGKDCNIWFDKWYLRGPLSRLINHEVLKQVNMCLKTKVSNMIDGTEWKWAIEWADKFDVVTKIRVPRLDANIKDKNEMNGRCFMKKFRDIDCLFNLIVDSTRLRLLGLNIKTTPSVLEASKV